MNEQTFIFEFPLTKAIINVETNPLYVKDLAIAYLKKREDVFGNICLVKDYLGCVLAVACFAKDDSAAVKFFTEDKKVAGIKDMEENA